jgi:F420-dependent oxidoreductase-like protein
MRLGLNLGYWGGGPPADDLALAQEADRLGYAVVWAAEAYGSDCVTVLSWVAARTERIDVGSAVMQIPARSAAMTAMTAATLDTLSGGRFRLGLGISGPQVSEGWHGVRFDEPLSRTREYVDVVRLALSRRTVEYAGRHLRLPLPDGPGKALHLTVRRVRTHIPLYLAAIGPQNLAMTGEIADGWLAVFFSPEHAGLSLGPLAEGAARAGKGVPGDPLAGFDVAVTVPVSVHHDVAAAADRIRAYTALYVGGMGSREQNFYRDLAARLGFPQEASRVQELFLTGRHSEALAAVPQQLIDQTALVGPPARIKDRLASYADAGVTTLTVAPYAETLEQRLAVLRLMAALAG